MSVGFKINDSGDKLLAAAGVYVIFGTGLIEYLDASISIAKLNNSSISLALLNNTSISTARLNNTTIEVDA